MTDATVLSSRSEALARRARGSLPGGNTRTTVYRDPYPLYAARGEGCRVWDVDGVARIDCNNNYTSLIHGHAHPALVDAACRQIALGTAFGMPTESEIDLAELLCARVASVERVRFVNSGTEAVMMALKAARAFTGRPKIAKCEGAYHGTYDYAEVSLDTGPADWQVQGPPASVAYARGTPQGVLDDVVVIPFNDIDGAVSLIRAHGPALAGVLVDPMPNRAGLVPADPAYLQALHAVCREVGALLIFDEVISFRLGHAGAQGLWGVEADLTTFGKIMGGGFPVGALGGRVDVMAVFDPTSGKPAVPGGGTFSANPVTMRAGLAAMELLDEAAFVRLGHMGDHLRHGIERLLHDHGIRGCATGRGSLLQVHLSDRPLRDYRSARPEAAEARRLVAFVQALLDGGVIISTNGLMALSTVMTGDDLEAVLAAIAAALSAIG
ncbi:MAG TPA: aspartate aminotransferase family protein [Acidisoma sp.]|uniref:aspartate aminotransferase family protein n=1 Tax=Acidisoma sp. TaxID=1872115 RepID=UPI002C01B91D|nr:aspartate aminotransferase family protein [Acidisoma sp.]HTH99463.1 aspartate aminotransferase family protein [Acidisoma sp.]